MEENGDPRRGDLIYKILGGGLTGPRIEKHVIVDCIDLNEHLYSAKPAERKKYPIDGHCDGTFAIRLRPQSRVMSIEKIQSTDHWCYVKRQKQSKPFANSQKGNRVWQIYDDSQ